jgi:predicted NUDIX family NTP pyrophosphohydrolase
MRNRSAGILVYRYKNGHYEVFLIHPGGPLWKNKDTHSWSIPKGEFDHNEPAFKAALREFKEETGYEISGQFQKLNPVKQNSGKTIYAWAVEGDLDETKIKSNNFRMEWPPKSGIYKEFPEADKEEWFPLDVAKEKMFKGQDQLIDELKHILM